MESLTNSLYQSKIKDKKCKINMIKRQIYWLYRKKKIKRKKDESRFKDFAKMRE
jgi:hypothetical protein